MGFIEAVWAAVLTLAAAVTALVVVFAAVLTAVALIAHVVAFIMPHDIFCLNVKKG